MATRAFILSTRKYEFAEASESVWAKRYAGIKIIRKVRKMTGKIPNLDAWAKLRTSLNNKNNRKVNKEHP
jgi:hypothetical protein